MDVVVWPTGRTADEQRLWKITIDGLCTLLPFLGFVIVTKLCVDDIFNGFSFLSCLNLK